MATSMRYSLLDLPSPATVVPLALVPVAARLAPLSPDALAALARAMATIPAGMPSRAERIREMFFSAVDTTAAHIEALLMGFERHFLDFVMKELSC